MKNLVVLFLLIALPISSTAFAQCKATIPGHDPSRYKANIDGTAVDQVTGLMWMRCDVGADWRIENKNPVCFADNYTVKKFKGTWLQALEQVKKTNETGFAGYKNWRLPNVKEIMSIISLNCNPPLDSTVFLSSESAYWTSTPSRTPLYYIKREFDTTLEERYETAAWIAIFQGANWGEITPAAMSNQYAIRLVRDNIVEGTP